MVSGRLIYKLMSIFQNNNKCYEDKETGNTVWVLGSTAFNLMVKEGILEEVVLHLSSASEEQESILRGFEKNSWGSDRPFLFEQSPMQTENSTVRGKRLQWKYTQWVYAYRK